MHQNPSVWALYRGGLVCGGVGGVWPCLTLTQVTLEGDHVILQKVGTC